MRHRKKIVKLGRTAAHRDSLLANQVCSLIQHYRIKTTLAKAKAVRPIAEKMLTLGKRGDIAARRLAAAHLGQKANVKKLFEVIAPLAANRKGGYTRIIKLGQRPSDAAPMAFLEWVDMPVTEEEISSEETASEEKKAPVKKVKTPKKVKAKKSKAKKVKAKRSHAKKSKVRKKSKKTSHPKHKVKE